MNHIVLAAEKSEEDWTSNSTLDPIFGVILVAIIVYQVVLVYRQEHAALVPPPAKDPKRRPAS